MKGLDFTWVLVLGLFMGFLAFCCIQIDLYLQDKRAKKEFQDSMNNPDNKKNVEKYGNPMDDYDGL